VYAADSEYVELNLHGTRNASNKNWDKPKKAWLEL
jgi:hypothetical protein